MNTKFAKPFRVFGKKQQQPADKPLAKSRSRRRRDEFSIRLDQANLELEMIGAQLHNHRKRRAPTRLTGVSSLRRY